MMGNEVGILFDQLTYKHSKGGFGFKRFCDYISVLYDLYQSPHPFVSDRTFGEWYYGWASSQPQTFVEEGRCREPECKDGPRVLVCDGKLQTLPSNRLTNLCKELHEVAFMCNTACYVFTYTFKRHRQMKPQLSLSM